ncbi:MULTISPECIES: hypothetical protein [unclassified Sphingobacterium]|uniref:hypothetical protein n=1 Tax=unclassified Sphingobacterium TaxID=2609468 RepID=UPI0025DEF41A|nr:hypothetical protein [Sphingobacterium sp. UBA5670]
MKQLLFVYLFLICGFFSFGETSFAKLENYRTEWLIFRENDRSLVGIRSFTSNGVKSVFFPCLGLVSDRSIIERLLSYGLIAVGSDARLAKGQQARNGRRLGSGAVLTIE